MKAMVLTGFGDVDKLVLRHDWPDPAPGPDEVKVRVTACGVNNTDIWTRVGAYGRVDDPSAPAGPRRTSLSFPRIQGADAVGLIDQVGASVDTRLVGARVLIDPVIRTEPDNLLTARYVGSDFDGGYAEYLIVPASNVVRAPENLTDIEAASLATPAGTAMRMLRRGGLSAGDRVLVTGASGGVGSALVQLASDEGADVTAVSRRPDVADDLMALGATKVVEPRAVGKSGTERFDVVLDIVAGSLAPAAISSLRRGGVYVVAGASGGANFPMDIRSIYLGHISVLGTSLFTSDDLRRVVELAASGRLKPVVDATFPLEQAAEAQAHFRVSKRLGNVVLTVT
jgi:NADPH:quinone reductase-like Zn-dependent oxidoreductase